MKYIADYEICFLEGTYLNFLYIIYIMLRILQKQGDYVEERNLKYIDFEVHVFK